MLYLQATKKALTRLGLGREKLAAPGATDSALGNWFVSVVPLGGRDAYLFMSTRSLLSFPILIGAREPEPGDMLLFLEHGSTMLLKSLKVPGLQSSQIQQDFAEVKLCTNFDKSLVGVHSAIANEYFQRVELQGGLTRADMSSIIAATNSTPRATLQWKNSFEVTKELLAASVA